MSDEPTRHPGLRLVDGTQPEASAQAAAPASMSEQERFELLVATDIEHERQLLYRALLIIESAAALILVREVMLWWMLEWR
ncbi:MAG: hypothetical protein JKY37_33525 [Nannocystaceae bacterium]|nr:hypothetical protein [Nannocystaceae bacterium]